MHISVGFNVLQCFASLCTNRKGFEWCLRCPLSGLLFLVFITCHSQLTSCIPASRILMLIDLHSDVSRATSSNNMQTNSRCLMMFIFMCIYIYVYIYMFMENDQVYQKLSHDLMILLKKGEI